MTPPDVHKARVATRRLRSNLKTLEAVLDPVWTRHVRGDLKWLGSALGDIRDADVLSGHLTAAPAELLALLARDRSAAVQRLLPVLMSERYLNLLDRLHAATRNPPVLSVADVDAPGIGRAQLTDLVGGEWRVLRRRVRKSGPRPSDRQLHRIRIGAKVFVTPQRWRRRSSANPGMVLRRQPKRSRPCLASTMMPSRPRSGFESRSSVDHRTRSTKSRWHRLLPPALSPRWNGRPSGHSDGAGHGHGRHCAGGPRRSPSDVVRCGTHGDGHGHAGSPGDLPK